LYHMTSRFIFHYGATGITFKKAKLLRQNQTAAEKILWDALRNRKLANHKFRRQHPVGPFIVDFFCNAANLVVEVDGAVHDLPEQKEYDQDRESYLRNLGLRVLRFRNEEVICELERVLHEIEQHLPSPKPFP
jgi:very-short-patch-repair endonuclease